MHWNGSNWSVVGTAGLSLGVVNYTSMALDSTGIRSIWSYVGSHGFSPSQAFDTSMALDSSGNPYVAYQDNGERATVMHWNGSSWNTVGSAGFSAGNVTYTSIAR